MTDKLTLMQILDYESKSSRIIPYISWKWMQGIAGWFLARKVRRKYDRYVLSKHYQETRQERSLL